MKARLGQNFLVDVGAQRRIAEALGSAHDQAVVEIGPGKAAITQWLVERSGPLIAIEFDEALAQALGHRYPGRLEVLQQDVLSVDLRGLAGRLGVAKLLVVGNLPYYITSHILLHLFAHCSVISRAVVMVQREVAERIVAEPGTRDYGLLSATCQLYARCELLFTLPPQAFSPPPEVWSSVVQLELCPRFEELAVEPEPFLAYLRAAFAQKRKTLMNNLRAAGISGERAAAAIQTAGVPAQARAEALSLEEQARIWRQLRDR